MTETPFALIAPRTARLLAWLALPLGSVGILRLFPTLPLRADGGSLVGWLAPAAAVAVAVGGAMAALLALAAAFRGDGSLRRALDAAAAGSLTAAAASVALAGPAGSAGVPPTALSVGIATTAIPLLAAALVAPFPLAGRAARLGVAGVIFAWVELAPAIGLVGGGQLTSIGVPIATVAATVAFIAAAAEGASGAGDRAGWIVGFATGASALALARPGTVDALPGLVTLAAAAAAMTLWSLTERGPAELRLHPATMEPVGPETAGPGEPDEADRLARELRGTIAELLAARQTIELQRHEVEELIAVDRATGVASRRAILERLRAEAAEARRYAHPVAVVLIDLDDLASLNRDHGLGIGDAVLRELALRLRVRIREADGIGRLTGDTFLAILPHTDERGVTVFAEAVRSRLTARPVETNGGPIAMTVSIGITILRPGASGVDDEQLLARAEEALASARAAGGNRIAFDRQHGLARLEDRRGGPQAAADEPHVEHRDQSA